jgi:hypothetical protein
MCRPSGDIVGCNDGRGEGGKERMYGRLLLAAGTGEAKRLADLEGGERWSWSH